VREIILSRMVIPQMVNVLKKEERGQGEGIMLE
jgi:hypothetical protein